MRERLCSGYRAGCLRSAVSARTMVVPVGHHPRDTHRTLADRDQLQSAMMIAIPTQTSLTEMMKPRSATKGPIPKPRALAGAS